MHQQQPIEAARRDQRIAGQRWRVDHHDALRAAGHGIHVVEQDTDDLAEAQRDDRQIVAAQRQHGNAEQDAEAGGKRRADRQDHQKRQVDAELRARQQRVAVGADGIERDKPEIQQSGIADHQIEPHGEQHIDQHVVGQPHVIQPGLRAPAPAAPARCRGQQRPASTRAGARSPCGRARRSPSVIPLVDHRLFRYLLAQQPGRAGRSAPRPARRRRRCRDNRCPDPAATAPAAARSRRPPESRAENRRASRRECCRCRRGSPR